MNIKFFTNLFISLCLISCGGGSGDTSPPPDTIDPIITLVGESNITLFQSDSYNEQGANATDNRDATVNVVISGTIDINTLGNYTITYSATDTVGNSSSITRAVAVIMQPDIKAPVIILNGDSNITLFQSDSYNEQGANATDGRGTTVNVVISGTIDINILGNYTITYSATDTVGNSSSITRAVAVIMQPDIKAPVITLNGDSNITLFQSDSYNEQGANATDDRDVTVNVGISGIVDTHILGRYTITYTAVDKAGNSSKMFRIITILELDTDGGDNNGNTKYHISGNVVGFFESDLVIQNNSADDLVINIDGAFSFTTEISEGSTYEVTVLSHHANQTCLVINGSGVVLGKDITDIKVTCKNILLSLQPAEKYDLANNTHSHSPFISADGRYVIFNITPDSNTTSKYERDIIRRDTQTGKMDFIAKSSLGIKANSSSSVISISADGRFVAFFSFAGNLIDGVNMDKKIGESNWGQVYVKDMQEGTVTIASKGNSGDISDGYLGGSDMSADGRYVAFTNNSSLDGQSTFNNARIYRNDRMSGKTTLVSSTYHNDNSKATISGDGLHVVYQSYYDSERQCEGQIYHRDMLKGEIKLISGSKIGECGDGVSRNPSISADGTYVVFESSATNLVQEYSDTFGRIYVRNLQSDEITHISYGSNDPVYGSTPSISADGRFVVFRSPNYRLIENDTNYTSDIFVYDMETKQLERVSTNSSGVEGDDYSSYARISDDGHYIVFESNATNLVEGDVNNKKDVFLLLNPLID